MFKIRQKVLKCGLQVVDEKFRAFSLFTRLLFHTQHLSLCEPSRATKMKGILSPLPQLPACVHYFLFGLRFPASLTDARAANKSQSLKHQRSIVPSLLRWPRFGRSQVTL